MDFPISLRYLHSSRIRRKMLTRSLVLINKTLWMNFGQVKDMDGEMKRRIPMEFDSDMTQMSSGHKKPSPIRSVTLPEKYPDGHPIKPKK